MPTQSFISVIEKNMLSGYHSGSSIFSYHRSPLVFLRSKDSNHILLVAAGKNWHSVGTDIFKNKSTKDYGPFSRLYIRNFIKNINKRLPHEVWLTDVIVNIKEVRENYEGIPNELLTITDCYTMQLRYATLNNFLELLPTDTYFIIRENSLAEVISSIEDKDILFSRAFSTASEETDTQVPVLNETYLDSVLQIQNGFVRAPSNYVQTWMDLVNPDEATAQEKISAQVQSANFTEESENTARASEEKQQCSRNEPCFVALLEESMFDAKSHNTLAFSYHKRPMVFLRSKDGNNILLIAAGRTFANISTDFLIKNAENEYGPFSRKVYKKIASKLKGCLSKKEKFSKLIVNIKNIKENYEGIPEELLVNDCSTFELKSNVLEVYLSSLPSNSYLLINEYSLQTILEKIKKCFFTGTINTPENRHCNFSTQGQSPSFELSPTLAKELIDIICSAETNKRPPEEVETSAKKARIQESFSQDELLNLLAEKEAIIKRQSEEIAALKKTLENIQKSSMQSVVEKEKSPLAQHHFFKLPITSQTSYAKSSSESLKENTDGLSYSLP